MANVTIQDLLEAQRALIETIPDIGIIVTRERHLNKNGFITLLMQEDVEGEANGVLILYQETIRQSKGPRVCTVQRQIRFSYEVIHPFRENDIGEVISFDQFINKLEAIDTALNRIVGTQQPWNLGITEPNADVEHQFLQGDGPIDVRTWSTGSEAIKTHYCSRTLDVLYVVNVHESANS
jgi:hypothetical protein